jgi:AcrR family transcriptional regulator
MKTIDLRRERELRRRAGYRETILRAAERVILRKGYSSATMDDIAREAQLSKATVYKYVPGKGALLFEIMSQYFDDLLARLEAILAGPGRAGDKLRLAIGRIIRDMEGKKNLTNVLAMDKAMLKLMRIFAAASGKPGSAPAADRKMIGMLREKRRGIVMAGARILEEGVASGEFRALDVGRAAEFIEAVVEGFAHARYWRGDLPMPADAADNLTRFILEGIRNPERSWKEN